MDWSVGVTTVPDRYHELLPRTLASIDKAGFPRPRIFVDGATSAPQSLVDNYHVSFRPPPRLRLHGSWVMAMMEMFVRLPTAHRFALFQDDCVMYRNLRQYVETIDYPELGYCNLLLWRQNERPTYGQWYKSNQRGLGAVAIIMSNEAVRTVLSSRHMVERPLDPNRGWKAVDGGIVTGMNKANPPWHEYVHNPSLVDHTGKRSTFGNVSPTNLASTFKGEDYDALELLQS